MKRLFTAAVLIGFVSGAALAQSSDPLVGNWKLNVAKSKGAKSGSTIIEAAGQGVKFTVDLVAAGWHGESLVVHRQLRRERRSRHAAAARGAMPRR